MTGPQPPLHLAPRPGSHGSDWRDRARRAKGPDENTNEEKRESDGAIMVESRSIYPVEDTAQDRRNDQDETSITESEYLNTFQRRPIRFLVSKFQILRCFIVDWAIRTNVQ